MRRRARARERVSLLPSPPLLYIFRSLLFVISIIIEWDACAHPTAMATQFFLFFSRYVVHFDFSFFGGQFDSFVQPVLALSSFSVFVARCDETLLCAIGVWVESVATVSIQNLRPWARAVSCFDIPFVCPLQPKSTLNEWEKAHFEPQYVPQLYANHKWNKGAFDRFLPNLMVQKLGLEGRVKRKLGRTGGLLDVCEFSQTTNQWIVTHLNALEACELENETFNRLRKTGPENGWMLVDWFTEIETFLFCSLQF